jgi:redox-sensitive bicupin YhaK (pirin superfamily)
MITLCRATERRLVQRGKQDTWLTFFPQDRPGPLAVDFGFMTIFNEMRLPPNGGTAPYSHDEVENSHDEAEIITYVHKGALAQEDSSGSSGVIHAGEFQYMTTGRGVRHKERNASQNDWAHIFRIALHPSIALRPSEVGLDCAYEQKRFTAAQRRNLLCVVASRDGRRGSLRFRQDVLIYSSILDPGHHLFHELLLGRSAWLHVLYGEAMLNEIILTRGDGVGVTIEPSVSLIVQEKTEILLVDLGPAANSHGSGVVP